MTTGYNMGLAKVAVHCSTDTFVVNQSLGHLINICGENRHLRQARKRYLQPADENPKTNLRQKTSHLDLTKLTRPVCVCVWKSNKCISTIYGLDKAVFSIPKFSTFVFCKRLQKTK